MAGGIPLLTKEQETLLKQVVGLGIDETRARRGFAEHNFKTADAALDYFLDPKPQLRITDESGKVESNDLKNQDSDLQRAINASLKEQVGGRIVSGADSNELAINKAIEESLKSASPQGFVDPDDPHKRARQLSPLLPVGLKNTGNICYFNSLLQMYTNIPWVASALMTAEIKPEVQSVPAVGLLKELQRALAFLHLSKRRYYDPAECVKALFKFNDKGTGKDEKMQHDAAEFNEIIVRGIDTAFQATNFSKDFVKNTLYGNLSQEFEGPGLPVQRTDVEVGPLILDIQGGDLMGALDAYTDSQIDKYTLPSGEVTTATKSLWFHRLPKVLCLQLQRVAYDAARKEALKVNTRFDFSCNIFLERYLVKNQEAAVSRKRKLKDFRGKKTDLNQELARYKNAGDRGLPLQGALEASLEFLAVGVPGLSPEQQAKLRERWLGTITGPERGQAIRCLQRASEAVKAEVEDLEKKLSEVEEEIVHVFDGLEQKKYQLLAVLVHEGRSAEQGHYWSYVRPAACYLKDAPEDGWYKYNDASCTRVSHKEVFEEASGGHATKASSAYFLVYAEAPSQDESVFGADASMEEGINSLIPDNLRAEVLADNEKFEVEKENWKKQEQTKSAGSKSQALIERFTNRMEDVDNLVAMAERRGPVPPPISTSTTTTTTTITTATTTAAAAAATTVNTSSSATTASTITAATTTNAPSVTASSIVSTANDNIAIPMDTTTSTVSATLPSTSSDATNLTTTTASTAAAPITAPASTASISAANAKIADDNILALAAFLSQKGLRGLAQLLVVQVVVKTLQDEPGPTRRLILEEFQKKLKAQGHPCVPLFTVADQKQASDPEIVPEASVGPALMQAAQEFAQCVSTGSALEMGLSLFHEGRFSEALDTVVPLATPSAGLWTPFITDAMGGCLYRVITEAQNVLKSDFVTSVDAYDKALQALAKPTLHYALRHYPNQNLVETVKSQMIEFCSDIESLTHLAPYWDRFPPVLDSFLSPQPEEKVDLPASAIPVHESKDSFQVLLTKIRRMDVELHTKCPFLPPLEPPKLITHKDEGKKEDEPAKG